MQAREVVNVYGTNGTKTGTAKTPAVFGIAYRADIVESTVNKAHLNTRNAYAVSDFAGYQTAASSWGTGRAVARVPRVPGGGSHRSGQAAFANFARGGGMFAPTKTYRKWTRQTTLTERRHAQAFAIAAAGCTSLVTARGHKTEAVLEFPLVVSNDIESTQKTLELKKTLEKLGCGPDMERCLDTRRIRSGKGKNRNRKYITGKGPLVVYSAGDSLPKVCSGLRGVECANVECLSIRQLAPGGVGGRLIVFTESAFNRLNNIFGDAEGVSTVKTGYKLPRCVISGSVNKVLQSDQVLSTVRPTMVNPKARKVGNYANPLKNKKFMAAITPRYEELVGIAAKKTTMK